MAQSNVAMKHFFLFAQKPKDIARTGNLPVLLGVADEEQPVREAIRAIVQDVALEFLEAKGVCGREQAERGLGVKARAVAAELRPTVPGMDEDKAQHALCLMIAISACTHGDGHARTALALVLRAADLYVGDPSTLPAVRQAFDDVPSSPIHPTRNAVNGLRRLVATA